MDLSAPQIAGSSLQEYDAAFREVNRSGTGTINAQEAANYLKRTQLPNEKLGKVWELADYSKSGSLDRRGFFIALKCCALIQKGQQPTVDNIHMDVGLPNMTSGPMSPAMPMTDGQSDLMDWSIPMEERVKYDAIFDSLGPVGGKLPGDRVKPVLLNSGLPMNILGKIWDLSDIDRDGYLDKSEMSVALHLIYRSLENDPLPAVLPVHIIPPEKRNIRRGSVSQIDGDGGVGIGRRTSMPAGAVPVLPTGQRSRTASMTSNDSIGQQMQQPMSPAMMSSAQHDVMIAGGTPERKTSFSSQGHRSASGTPLPMLSAVVPPALWIVNKAKYEQAFNNADTDHDGLVNGNDIKQSFLMSGLAQNYLAHIWTLVDLSHSGNLNLEQYALAMHLIEQKREYNVEPPASLTPDLVPPSFRPNPAGMTDIATSTHETAATNEANVAESKDLIDARKELESVLAEKRQLESGVIQLEADSTVKNSEIKNLEIESHTLENTVKQLERQKTEAGKRLSDLDLQRDGLQVTLNELLAKIDTEQHEINALKDDVDSTHKTAQSQEEELNRKRNELQSLRNEENKLEVNLQMQKANLDTVAQQHGVTERKIGMTETNMKQLLEQTSQMEQTLSILEEILASENIDRLRHEEHTLLAPVKKLDLPSVKLDRTPRMSSGYQDNAFSMPQQQQQHAAAPPLFNKNAFEPPAKMYPALPSEPLVNNNVVDPFKTVDDPFASTGGEPDPFGADPFGSDPFAATPANDPFSSNNAFEADPFGPPAPAAKKPPSRPPPPKSKTPTPVTQSPPDPFAESNVDPFAAETGQNNGPSDGFANFADFANFS